MGRIFSHLQSQSKRTILLCLALPLLLLLSVSATLAHEPPPFDITYPFQASPASPEYAIDWDQRLCGRFTELLPAYAPAGQWYWRLIRARWYDEYEPPFNGQHNIFVDTLNGSGNRQVGVPVRFSSLDGSQTFQTKATEAKPGELYAVDFSMYALAPAYRAEPANGEPADVVRGMGMGNFEHPDWPIHTSYLFVWQWTQSNGEAPPQVCGGTLPPTATPTSPTWPTATPTPTAVPTSTPTPQFSPTPTPIPLLVDDFNDNEMDLSLWSFAIFGIGPVMGANDGRLQILHPSYSIGDPFGAEVLSRCRLAGDFDVRVDYLLLQWPSANGVRLGLVTTPDENNVARISFAAGDGFAGYPGDVYLTFFADGVQGITGTSDVAGSLRLVRTGGSATGYYYRAGNWVPLHSGPISTADVRFGLRTWSHSQVFGGAEVKVAFDNLAVNRGQIVCPETPVPTAYREYLPMMLARQ